MKPERIQAKTGNNELREQVETLLRTYPEWVLRNDEAVLARLWRMPDRRSATALITWLSHVAEALEVEPELTLHGRRVTVRLAIGADAPDASSLRMVEAIEGVAA